MALLTPIPAYNFSGNIPDLVINDVPERTRVPFTLKENGHTIVSETYDAIAGRVVVRLKDILENSCPCPAWTDDVFPIAKYDFQLTLNEFMSGSFYCLRGGLGVDVPAETYLKSNFLTWQPQTRRTLYHTPQYLRYAALADSVCKATGYFADKTSQTVDLLTGMTAGNIYTIDVTFGNLRAKFSKQPIYIDVWVEDGDSVKTWTQRYVLAESFSMSDDFFLFENSLGGFDTIRFSGDRREIDKPESVSALFDQETLEYDIEREKSFKKYTGYFEDDMTRLWALDFFNSFNRYHLCDGELKRIYVSEPKLEIDRNVLGGYEFTFAHAKQTKYLNLPRTEVPELLEIVDPAEELFFLAPRLNQFQLAELTDDVLIPVQRTNSNKWFALPAALIRATLDGFGSVVEGLTNIFHPKGGRSELDFVAKDITAESLSTSKDIEAREIIARILRTPDFLQGLLGDGIGTPDGQEWQVNSLLVRKYMTVIDLLIQKARHVGGMLFLTPAAIKVSRVEESETYWDCFFETDNGEITNDFVAGDQARLQTFANVGRYLWSLVTEVGTDYIRLSKADKDGADAPRAGDDLVQLGNRTDANRQTAVVISATGGELGIVTYNTINSFTLAGRELSWFGRHNGVTGGRFVGELALTTGQSVEEYTQQKVDSVEIGTVNLIDGSEAIKITASASATHAYLRFPLHVRPGDEFALSIGSIEILAGNPTEFSCNILTSQMDRPLAHKQLTLDNRTAVYKILEKEQEQDAWFLMYAGKETQTQGVSVTYHKVMLVKGNRPALTWSPSLNDQKAQTQEQIDSIQVGSDNLMDDTQRPNPSNTELWNKTVSASVWGEVGEFVAVKIRGQWGRLWQSIAEGFIGGQQYRFSCWVKRDASMETVETKAQLSVGRNAVTIISATLDGVKLGAGGSTGVFSGKSLAGIVISADTFQRLECIFEASETVPGDSFRLEFYTSNYQTNTPCGVVYGYYLVKGNKATDDWRPSLNDTKKAIAAAQAAADQAKEDAADSAQKLEDWSSDELISPPEKPGLVQQKADIESEYGEIGSQADRYGLKSSTYWTAYNSAYTLAIQALTKYTASTPESIPVESDYDYIAAYYPKRQIMLDQIAAAAQAYSEKVVNEVEIGTVNLLDDTKNMTGTTTDWHRTFWDYIPVPGRQYTARLLNTGNTPIRVFIGEKKSDGGYLGDYGGNIAASGEVSVYTFTTKSDAGHILVGLTNKDMAQSVSLGDYDISDIMLVEGNKAPATWSPSLNDQKAQTQEMVDASLPATRNLALKTEGQLDFDTSSWAGLYLDLAEQPVIGQQYVLSWDDIQFTETSHPSIRLWINSFTGAVYVKDVTQTGPGSVVVTIPDTLLTNRTYRILFGGHNGAMTGYVKNPMWSKGNKVMPWTPAIEDAPNEIREEAKATGIYLSEKKIDVVADRFRITSTAGREIMRADADGNRVSMENLDVQAGATIGPVEVTETGLAVKAEGEDLQTVISNQEFGSLSDALSTGKTSIVSLNTKTVYPSGEEFDMGTFSTDGTRPCILSVSGRVFFNTRGRTTLRIYLAVQSGNAFAYVSEIYSASSSTSASMESPIDRSITISSVGSFKIICTATLESGTIAFPSLSATLKESVKRLEVRPSSIFGSMSSTQYFILGREKANPSAAEKFRAVISNEGGKIEVLSDGVYASGNLGVQRDLAVGGGITTVGDMVTTGGNVKAAKNVDIGQYLTGLALSSKSIAASSPSGSTYQITADSTLIDAHNTNGINILLPTNPKAGQIVMIRQYAGGYTLKSGSKQMHRAGSLVTELWNDAYASLVWCRWDGQYWAVNYLPSF